MCVNRLDSRPYSLERHLNRIHHLQTETKDKLVTTDFCHPPQTETLRTWFFACQNSKIVMLRSVVLMTFVEAFGEGITMQCDH